MLRPTRVALGVLVFDVRSAHYALDVASRLRSASQRAFMSCAPSARE
jgi:hypothetical protein